MGRKKIVLSTEELAERKKRYWGEERNARRRQAYATDPQRRANLQQAARLAYRQQQEAEGQSVQFEDCRQNIPNLPQIGQVRVVRFPDGASLTTLSLTLEEFGLAIGRETKVVYRWLREGMFPRPALVSKIGTRDQGVFSAIEATALLEAFAVHQQDYHYYRIEHVETTERLFAAAEKAIAIVRKEARNGTTADIGEHAHAA